MIRIPFCFMPNSLYQEVDLATCRRSLFQVKFVADVAALSDFAYFVIMQHDQGEIIFAPEFKCPFLLHWYTKDGVAHMVRLGKRRVLRTFKPEAYGPVPLNHVVYTSRCRP